VEAVVAVAVAAVVVAAVEAAVVAPRARSKNSPTITGQPARKFCWGAQGNISLGTIYMEAT
jgi:hypothetical protein